MGLEEFYIPSREYEERTNNLLMTFHWILEDMWRVKTIVQNEKGECL